MDGAGDVIKQGVKVTISYRPDKVIRNTTQLMKYLPTFPNINTTYTEHDVNVYKESFPKPLENLKLVSKSGFGISKVHEIFIPRTGENIKWKKVSSDKNYQEATIQTSPLAHRKEVAKETVVEDVESDSLVKIQVTLRMVMNQLTVSFSCLRGLGWVAILLDHDFVT